MSKQALLEKLTDKAYRDAFTSDEIDVGLPMQLRSMREERGWKQGYVAERTRTKQPRFSLMEKPGYGNFSLNTLKKLASLFDVGLIVSFVPWSEMIDFTEAISNKRLAVPGFCDEYARLEHRYNRAKADAQETTQGVLNFSAGGTSAIITTTSNTQSAPVIRPHKPVLTDARIDIPVNPIYSLATPGANTYVNA
jgi:transcriptional regulator with XRE-family HTH domain